MHSRERRGIAQGSARRWSAWPHIALLGAILLTVAGCSDSGPDPDDAAVGRWWLVSIDGSPLPAAGSEIPTVAGVVRSGRLEIREPGSGFPRWAYCGEDDDGLYEGGGGLEYRYSPGDTPELAIIFPNGVLAYDTLRASGDALTWEYNLRSDPGNATDALRFRRLAAGEHEGPVCALVDQP